MTDTLELMELSTDDFTWYEAGAVLTFVERNIPQIMNELAINGESVSIAVINSNEVPDYDAIKMAFWFRDTYLPVYENGDFYVKPDGSYATVKRSDGYALLGIRNESSSEY